LLSDAPRFELYQPEISNLLTDWNDSSLALNPIIDHNPALEEARPLARDLGELGRLGREALAYLTSDTPPPVDWRNAALARLDEAAKPRAALEFVVILSLRKLVIAASELPQLKTMPAQEWKKRVNTLASPAK
jgi:hexosaminidase